MAKVYFDIYAIWYRCLIVQEIYTSVHLLSSIELTALPNTHKHIYYSLVGNFDDGYIASSICLAPTWLTM